MLMKTINLSIIHIALQFVVAVFVIVLVNCSPVFDDCILHVIVTMLIHSDCLAILSVVLLNLCSFVGSPFMEFLCTCN